MLYLLALRDLLGALIRYPVADWRSPLSLYRAAVRGRRSEARRCR